jgi:hypothetical protein
LTATDVWSRIDPTSLPGLHYLCAACENSTIPSEEDGKLKKKPKPSSREEDDPDILLAAPSEVDITLLNDTQPRLHDDTLPSYQEQTLPNSQEVMQTSSAEETQMARVSHRNEPPAVSNEEGPTATPAATRNNICSFYRKGTCRYGVSGRGCPKEHPKPCRKLLQHGTKTPHGCTLGRDRCDKFHPKMCPSSIRKGECYNTNCGLKHVAGTKRTPANQTDVVTGAADAVNNQANTTLTGSDFLDALRLLKAEMLEAMDMKLALMISSQNTAAHAHVPQAVAPTNTVAPAQVTTVPVNWMSTATHLVPNMMCRTYGGQVTQQPFGPSGGAPTMYVPANMGHAQGTQQPVYMAAVPPAQTH